MRPALLLAVLLATVTGSACAQVPRKPTASPATDTASRMVSPNAMPAPAVPGFPKGYTDKQLGGTTSSTFPNGLPERDLDNGTSRADQPRANRPQAGAQPTRSILGRSKRR